jgi:HK97 gp10 family phage protein
MTGFQLRRWEPDPTLALVNRRAEAWLTSSADVATNAARRQAPVRTGRLRNSIVSLPLERRDGRMKAGVWAQAPYALWVEIGTRRMRSQPYLGPALETVRDAAAALVGQIRVGVVEARP